MIAQCVAGMAYVGTAGRLPTWDRIPEGGQRQIRMMVFELIKADNDQFNSDLFREDVFKTGHNLNKFPAEIEIFNDVCTDLITFIRMRKYSFLSDYSENDFKNFLQFYVDKAMTMIAGEGAEFERTCIQI